MATPISLDLPPYDPRLALQERLQQAPADHAEAMLAAYDVLQGLHDSGLLDLVRGMLESKDEVLGAAVQAAGSAQSVRGIRNLLLLIELLGRIEPEVLQAFTRTAPIAMKKIVEQPEHPSLWRLLKDFFWNRNFRRGMAAVNIMLETLGRTLNGNRKGDTLTP